MNSGWRLGRRPGLDGLRGVAILLVLGGHSLWLPGASSVVGVGVFFGLSGFLITALLLDELEESGRVSLRAFYLRRARRLLPALAVYLAFAAMLVGWAVVPVIAYVENWVMVAHGSPDPTAIAWSLSVEEQFYLLWPLTFLVAPRWPRAPWIVASVGVAASIGMRLLLWNGGAGSWRIYYGSDTRADALLIGCLLALTVKRLGLSDTLRWAWLPGAGTLAACCAFQSPTAQVLAYPAVVSLATGAIVVGALAGGSRWLVHPVLRWFGKRSYALYLWHYVLVIDARHGVLPMWVALLVALVLAELSWRLVEAPFLRRSARSVVGGDPSSGKRRSVEGTLVHGPGQPC